MSGETFAEVNSKCSGSLYKYTTQDQCCSQSIMLLLGSITCIQCMTSGLLPQCELCVCHTDVLCNPGEPIETPLESWLTQVQ